MMAGAHKTVLKKGTLNRNRTLEICIDQESTNQCICMRKLSNTTGKTPENTRKQY